MVRNRITTAGKTPGLSREEGAVCLGIGVKEHYKIHAARERLFGKMPVSTV